MSDLIEKIKKRIEARKWKITDDTSIPELIGMQYANNMNDWCLKIIDEELAKEPQEYNSDLISKKKLIEYLFYSAYGNRYPTRDCDNFPITISFEDLRKVINNQPQVQPIVKTQADRIRNMSDEELAELIDEVEFCKGKVLEECKPEECRDCAGCCSNTLAWLQSEAEREEV